MLYEKMLQPEKIKDEQFWKELRVPFPYSVHVPSKIPPSFPATGCRIMKVRQLSREYHESLASESLVNALSKYSSLSWSLALVFLASLTWAGIIMTLSFA